MKRIVYTLTALLVLASCSPKPKTAEEIFNEESSGVVLILNSFYYRMELPNGNYIYFKGLDEEGELDGITPNKEDIEENQNVVSGTGFFVDDKGTIMTNRHVAEPVLDKVAAKKSYRGILHLFKQLCSYTMSQLSDEYDELNSQISALESAKKQSYYYNSYDGNYYWDTEKINNINASISELEEKKKELKEQYNETSEYRDNVSNLTDLDDMEIEAVCTIGIAYNDTHVTDKSDFLSKNPCVVVKVSDKKDVDLALIQLKSKVTPINRHVFSVASKNKGNKTIIDKVKYVLSDDDEDEGLKIGAPLHMIGYNAGVTLAVTNMGIQAQLTSGNVTQTPTYDRLLYDIATIQGSSGSPVVDEQGNLVAVNYAKTTLSDNFNFGIPEDRIKEFMHWK